MQEREKAKRIIDELLTYFFSNDIEDIRIGLDFTSEGFYIEMQGQTKDEPEGVLNLLELLNTPRDLSIESYYDELLGITHHEEEDYHLLGLMIDEAEINFDSPIFDIKVFRKK
ncbi:hypothetical protein JZO66_01980 [Enterococcus sp. DIV0242_7C1]|uniref:Uncharacterized protein n=1 Tax=Candidatus Enterococcus dunnyi TaxID=1834192 RepID=A0A200JFN5_9ENTE|nr:MULTISPECIES: hypothetical protein [unclassified Enterococcus]MBO0469298.1 hypothetical protein [Enterococcus sp. DIV0242_7C1]MCA5012881.1 hypothetical protein [Enterococcus sp. S23]MCA5016132.1 hypothetical protein [Enterococcus sp. S22(2020)]OUZ35407.1 hypothetical protein A5889_000883 [Enterococcus sp. 9D6_DIV0238]